MSRKNSVAPVDHYGCQFFRVIPKKQMAVASAFTVLHYAQLSAKKFKGADLS